MSAMHPHCESPWPFGYFNNHAVETIKAAISGASCCANLLSRDESISVSRSIADDPDDEGPVFTPLVREGLALALRTCLDVAQKICQHMEKGAHEARDARDADSTDQSTTEARP